MLVQNWPRIFNFRASSKPATLKLPILNLRKLSLPLPITTCNKENPWILILPCTSNLVQITNHSISLSLTSRLTFWIDFGCGLCGSPADPIVYYDRSRHQKAVSLQGHWPWPRCGAAQWSQRLVCCLPGTRRQRKRTGPPSQPECYSPAWGRRQRTGQSVWPPAMARRRHHNSSSLQVPTGAARARRNSAGPQRRPAAGPAAAGRALQWTSGGLSPAAAAAAAAGHRGTARLLSAAVTDGLACGPGSRGPGRNLGPASCSVPGLQARAWVDFPKFIEPRSGPPAPRPGGGPGAPEWLIFLPIACNTGQCFLNIRNQLEFFLVRNFSKPIFEIMLVQTVRL